MKQERRAAKEREGNLNGPLTPSRPYPPGGRERRVVGEAALILWWQEGESWAAYRRVQQAAGRHSLSEVL